VVLFDQKGGGEASGLTGRKLVRGGAGDWRGGTAPAASRPAEPLHFIARRLQLLVVENNTEYWNYQLEQPTYFIATGRDACCFTEYS